MAPTNGQASSIISVSQQESDLTVWDKVTRFLIQRRVQITGILLSSLLIEDLVDGVRPRSLFDFQSVYSMLGLALVVAGVALRSWAAGTLHKNSQLTTGGPYGILRHPLYVGSFMIMLGACTLINDRENIWFVVGPILALYVFRAIHEERSMAKRFPAKWDEYTRDVPRFLPRRWPRGAFTSWSRDQWMRNREYRLVGAVSLGLVALQAWHRMR